jgi:hypothetical protein
MKNDDAKVIFLINTKGKKQKTGNHYRLTGFQVVVWEGIEPNQAYIRRISVCQASKTHSEAKVKHVFYGCVRN